MVGRPRRCHPGEIRMVVRGSVVGLARYVLRALPICLIALLAGGAVLPLHGRQESPTRLFDQHRRQAIHAPLQVRRLGGIAAGASSTRNGAFAWEGAEWAPGEGRSTGALVAGGLTGGVAGIFIGGAAGARLARIDCDVGCDESALYMALLGAIVGESFMLPLGVHLADRRLGSYLPSMLTSVALTGAGLGLAYALPHDVMSMGGTKAILITVPMLQLVSSILIERRTARR